MKSNLNKMPRRDLFILGFCVLLGSSIYLLASKFTYAIGFPLDDSWIHQTYARNLALHGEWSFRPGILSAGSTSPLWSTLLSFGFLLRLSPYIWTYILGGLTLIALAVICESAARRIVAAYRPRLPWVGLLFAFEWHLGWASMSGMETLLHALLVTAVLILLMTNSRRYLTLGLLTGLSVWVRPDGLTLLGPAFMTIFFIETEMRSRLRALTLYLIGFGSLFLVYLLFNLAIGGSPMPNTFYAKQAEYAAWQAKPAIERIGQMLLQLLVGPALILLPGVLGWLVMAFRRREWGTLSVAMWCAGYLWLYVSRLPVYQHGRYIMPVMPVIFLFGVLGLAYFIRGFRWKTEGERLIGRRLYLWSAQVFWLASLALTTLGFVLLGARSYAQDVAVIESEMVATARWVAKNLPADSLVAAHDIGTLGYFDHHELVDLAGLISPEVIPFIRDEVRLAGYLDQEGADVVIAFPEFYPRLLRNREIIYVTGGSFAPKYGQENMAVFRWKSP